MDYEESAKQDKRNQVGNLTPINYTINAYDRSDNDYSNLLFMSREEMLKKKYLCPDEENDLI